jgi:Tol biopolymer transport system component/DNA-binding winged helix-turn-helix (wHTH) protein
MEGTPRPRIFRFGAFELDTGDGELRKHGVRLRLQDQPLKILVTLLEKRGEIVPREDLVRIVWPDGIFVDYERGLNAAVTRLRQTLGDSAEQPRYIETITRKGYRFIGSVVTDTGTPESSTPLHSVPGRRIGIRVRWFLVAAAVTGVGVVAIVAGRWFAAKDRPGALVQLTRGSGLSTDPAVSPDGRLLAFVSDRGGKNLHLWVQQLDGSFGAVQLTHDDVDVREPAFSPDGSTLVFRSAKNGGGIYTIPAIGGELTQIASDGRNPRFSPDGKWIAYWTGVVNGADNAIGRAYVAPAKGGVSRLVGDDLPSAAYPVWAADSAHLLVFSSDVLRFIGMMDWWVLALDGGRSQRTEAFANLQRQGFDFGGLSMPRAYDWSSGEVIFTAAHGDSVNIWRIRLPDGDRRVTGLAQRVTAGTTTEASPTLTRRGQLIFASLNRTLSIGSVSLTPDGSAADDLHLLTETGYDWAPSISADGHYLAFTTRGANLDTVIRTKDLGTNKERTLASKAIHPEISRDGYLIAYNTMLPDGRKEVISRNGDRPQLVTRTGGYVYSWSADNTRLLGIKLPHNGPIYSFDVQTGKEAVFLTKPGFELYQAKFAPDESAILVQAKQNSPKPISKLFIVPLHDSVPDPDTEWIPVGTGTSWDDKPQWASDGSLVYFVSDRDGYRCLWAQRINTRTKRPDGESFGVHHFHGTRPSMDAVGLWQLEIAVAADKVVMGLGEITGNIWSRDLH